VGGGFYCFNNNLTSLSGCPENVGGGFYCSNNNLTSLSGCPKTYENMFDCFLKKGFIFADNILTKMISKRKKGDVFVYKTCKIATTEFVYIAANNEGKFAHGNSVKEAVEELLFKTTERDVEEYKNMPLSTEKTPQEWAFIYRAITGACRLGVKSFMDSKSLKKKYTLEEILVETKERYQGKAFKQVTTGGKQ
jgi:hypothetical protein